MAAHSNGLQLQAIDINTILSVNNSISKTTYNRYQKANDLQNITLGQKSMDNVIQQLKGDKDEVEIPISNDGTFSHKRDAPYVHISVLSISLSLSLSLSLLC